MIERIQYLYRNENFYSDIYIVNKYYFQSLKYIVNNIINIIEHVYSII